MNFKPLEITEGKTYLSNLGEVYRVLFKDTGESIKEGRKSDGCGGFRALTDEELEIMRNEHVDCWVAVSHDKLGQLVARMTCFNLEGVCISAGEEDFLVREI